MTQDDRQNGEPDLIGYHLGLIDESEALRIAAQIAASPELRARQQTVAAELTPLSAFNVAPPAAGLADRILARVQNAPRLAAEPEDDALDAGDDAGRGGPIISLRELVSLAAAIALMVGVFVPAFQRTRSVAEQAACLANLGGLGGAFGQYAQSNNDVLPYAGPLNGPWIQSAASPTPAVGNSRQVYLLLKWGFAQSPRQFLCAGRPNDRAMADSDVKSLYDFPSQRNVSYSSPLQADPMQRTSCDPRQPLLADHNPQFQDRIFRPRDNVNSDSHGDGAGQNVLRNDGSAGWTSRTDVGPDGDDIMRIANLSQYTGWERPSFRTDTILVP